uniref:Amidase domain-containing protein n=1 Tax=Fagus sylvatica TaxID=28930 RepID=A0A2N9IK72_FAGSY
MLNQVLSLLYNSIPCLLYRILLGMPICRTVEDAVYVLDAIVGIVGIDHDDNATIGTSQYIPQGGYAQFLKADGLRGKRLGIVRDLFNNIGDDTIMNSTVEQHLKTLRRGGAILVDNLKIANIDEISSSEETALVAEFKIYINAYLNELVASPIRSLSDLIAFNKKNSELERLDYGQEQFIKAEKAALENLAKLTREGFVKLMTKNKLDALVSPGYSVSSILAVGGFPGVIVPAGFDSDRVPFGLCFGGLKGSEPKLIEIAYAFEQATKIRKPPKFNTYKALLNNYSQFKVSI